MKKATRHLLTKSIQNNSADTLRKGFGLLAATCLIATVGYVSAGWDWLDAVYMVTITIFGVGYGEVRPIEEPWLKFFTMGVIFAGCSSLIYVIGGVVQMLAEGEIEQMLGIRNRSREIQQLSDHTIICGYGRVGRMLAAELSDKGESLVILDRSSTRVSKAIDDGFLATEGSAADDDALRDAGIFRAKTLATVLPNDAANVFITLTARELSNGIRIIARAEDPCTERKLLRSGASSVVMPAAIGAVRIAQLVRSEKSQASSLPEDRFRILTSHVCKEETALEDSSMPEDEDAEETVQHEVEELAELASDLTRSVVARHDAEVASEVD